MVRTIQGKLEVRDSSIAIIASRFNDFVVKGLISGAVDCLERHGADTDRIDLFRLPGAFEIPAMLKQVCETSRYNAIVCLGALIRGNTPHFDFISSEVTKGIAVISMEYKIPVGYGIITADNLEQAIERAGSKNGNKGWEAALSVIEMLSLYSQLKD